MKKKSQKYFSTRLTRVLKVLKVLKVLYYSCQEEREPDRETGKVPGHLNTT